MTIEAPRTTVKPAHKAGARQFGTLGVLLFAAAATASVAQAAQADGRYDVDRPGGADHPLLSRYQGSNLIMYGQEALGSTSMVFDENGKPVLRPLEGKVSNRLYFGPKDASPLEIIRNYRHALESAGFQVIYACEAAACEKARVQNKLTQLPRKAVWEKSFATATSAFDSGNQPGFQYVSARKNGPGGVTYVQVALAGTKPGSLLAGRVRQFISIVEPAKAELGKVTVDAGAIGASLQRDGKIALYGVTFDTNKAVLREESTAQLTEMANALKAAPSLKVYIVGHTDNQGDATVNTQLSQKRADAVAAALSGTHGIAASRLSARGVADLAPVSTNATEEGRAKNRRVELVAR